jgi:hypothetical protein
VDVVITSQLLDLFWFHGQFDILKNVVRLSKVGTKVIGCTFGTLQAEATEHKSDGYGMFSRFYHSQYSMEILWIDLGTRTNTKWRVKAANVDLECWGLDKEDFAWMTKPTPLGMNFIATRES